MNKYKFLKIYLWTLAVFTTIWWPFSHWFFADWYHNLMGFDSYDYSLVKIIGTAGLVPCLGLIFAAINPIRNRDIIIIILGFSVAMAGTYIFLIFAREFPTEEFFNVGLLLGNVILLSFIYPWRNSREN